MQWSCLQNASNAINSIQKGLESEMCNVLNSFWDASPFFWRNISWKLKFHGDEKLKRALLSNFLCMAWTPPFLKSKFCLFHCASVILMALALWDMQNLDKQIKALWIYQNFKFSNRLIFSFDQLNATFRLKGKCSPRTVLFSPFWKST